MKHNTFTKLVTLALAVVLALSLAACGSKNSTDGDKTAATIKIGVPNDTTNEARALLLLQSEGLIKLADDAGLEATPNDIVENPKNLTFTELEAAMVPNAVSEVDIAVINSNYAMEAGFNPVDDALALEGSDSP